MVNKMNINKINIEATAAEAGNSYSVNLEVSDISLVEYTELQNRVVASATVALANLLGKTSPSVSTTAPEVSAPTTTPNIDSMFSSDDSAKYGISEGQKRCLNGLRKGGFYSGTEEDIAALTKKEASPIIEAALKEQKASDKAKELLDKPANPTITATPTIVNISPLEDLNSIFNEKL